MVIQMMGGIGTVSSSSLKPQKGCVYFASVILLAGIEQQEKLDSAEITVIKSLDCLAPGKRGYNIHDPAAG